MALPPALLTSLAKAPGFIQADFEAVHAAEDQIISIRKNPAKQAVIHADLIDSAVPWCPHGYYLQERPIFTADPLFHAGAYYVQEASSMFLWHILNAVFGADTENKKVLDLCAAPGGKTTLLLSYFTNGLVVANESIKTRASILVENTTKWGMDNVVVTNNDPSHFQKLPAFFDLIVVDAPCSGSGLFRKDPSAVEEWSTDAVIHCSARQERILADILPALTEQGLLVYSTCSYSVEENEMIAEWLIHKMDMEPVFIPVDPTWNIVETAPNGFRFYPNKLKGEGFFIAVFRKKNKAIYNTIAEHKLTFLNNTEKQAVDQFCSLSDQYVYFKNQETIRVFNTHFQQALQQLAANLYIKKAGIAMGALKGKDLVPAHDFALANFDKDTVQQVALDALEAMDYLRKKDFAVEGPKGWVLFTYQNLGLGWAKLLSNRLNNYYPSAWRIRKDSF
jgi:16S rRNA C967 or C1407 C5-methylase (RsmB/RsmF family)/NOL1/NOP2/fmu family ribosome biogenesis protein